MSWPGKAQGSQNFLGLDLAEMMPILPAARRRMKSKVLLILVSLDFDWDLFSQNPAQKPVSPLDLYI